MKETLHSILMAAEIPLAMAICLAMYSAPVVIYYRIRQKGYSPFQTIAVYLLWQMVIALAGVAIIGLLLAVGNAFFRFGKLNKNWDPDSNDVAAFSLGAIFLLFLFLVTIYCIRFLPVRRAKAHAVSTFPLLKNSANKWASYIRITFSFYLLRVIGIVLSLVFIWAIPSDPTVSRSARTTNHLIFAGLILVLLVSLLLKVRQRYKKISQQALFNQTRDPFILYLRSFSVELDIFYIGRVAGVRTFLAMKAFDQFFSGAVNNFIGPLIALGSPIDHWLDRSLWHNAASAELEYGDDQTWKEKFLVKLDHCSGVFLHTAITENIDFELTEILHRGYAPKLFIMTHPPMKPFLLKRWIPFWNWLRGTPPVKWQAVAGLLNRCGYQLSSEEPRPGSLITFDAQNKSVLLAADLRKPEEYLRQVQDWLKQANQP